MQYVIGVDGGGTKTHVRCCDMNGKVIGESTVGPTNITSTSPVIAAQTLLEGVLHVTASLQGDWEVTKIVIGVAGVDVPAEVASAQRLFTEALKDVPVRAVEVVNDVVIALRSGSTHLNAIALISGTGSNCYGRNAAGEEAKAGGVDFLLADEGSGYAIGLATLRAAVKSYDGRSPKTLLEEMVTSHFHVPSIGELKSVVYHPLLTKTQVAELSQICFRGMIEHDRTALQIWTAAAEDLAEMIIAVLTRLKLLHTSVECVLVGGIATLPEMELQLKSLFAATHPQLKFVIPDQPAVVGAVRLALGE